MGDKKTNCAGCGDCERVICPYCGSDNVDRDTLVCCGEPHGVLTADHEDNDCPCVRVCGEERACEVHAAEEMAEWAAYFGIRPGMSQQERRNQIEAFRPPGMEWARKEED